MATLSTALERSIAEAWEKQYVTGVNSGIIGDTAHAIEGGYHISIQDQPSTNYSVTRPDDKAPPGTWPRNVSAAIDQSMSRADMIICYKRVFAVWTDHSDTRRKYFNAFNVWDGTGDAVRLDFVANTSSFANSTHTWHTHGELRRRYVNDPVAGRAWLSMTGGQTHAKWIEQEANGGDMTPAQEQMLKDVNYIVNNCAFPDGRKGRADQAIPAWGLKVTALEKTVAALASQPPVTPAELAAIVTAAEAAARDEIGQALRTAADTVDPIH